MTQERKAKEKPLYSNSELRKRRKKNYTWKYCDEEIDETWDLNVYL
jgi:hypothetical protein